jgi:ferritin-like metal-binding protein YciE
LPVVGREGVPWAGGTARRGYAMRSGRLDAFASLTVYEGCDAGFRAREHRVDLEEVDVPDELHDQLTKYLTDAHSIEVQALAQLRTAPKLAGDPQLSHIFEEHLAETEDHERLTRELLDARDASPSKLKDAVMGAGGKGFLLFARLNPDTPGKLYAHALSYEGLELASYELLARVAELAGETEVVETARRIRDEERSMMDRLEAHVDDAYAASQREHPRDDVDELLPKYLADAHAIEEQAIQLLERAPKLVEDPQLASVFADHLAETRDHAELVEERLAALGGGPNRLQDAVMRLGALNWGAFFQGHPDTPGKLTAFAYAFEHLEIGGYELLQRTGSTAGDEETVELARRILAQERHAAELLALRFDVAATASLRAVGVTV